MTRRLLRGDDIRVLTAACRQLLMAMVAAALLCAACGGSSDPAAALAQTSCEQLEASSTPLEKRVAQQDLIDATNLADDGGDDNPPFADVLIKMRAQCPNEVDELLGVDAEGAGVSAADIELEVGACDDHSASGTVRNASDIKVDVTVEVRVVDHADTLLGTGSTVIDGLDPGQRGTWEAYHSADSESPFTCKGEVGAVRPD